MNTAQHTIKYRKKLISNARAIISNQIAMPLGAVKMAKLIYWASATKAFEGIDLEVFIEYTNQFNGCPVGTERLLWDKDALKEQDKFLDELTLRYKNQLLDKCFAIISINWTNK